MNDAEARLKALEEKVESLEKQLQALRKRVPAAGAANRRNDYRDKFDSLDYPER